MKKKRIVMAFVLLVAAGLFLWSFLGDYSRALEANWGFTLPWRAFYREIYAKDSGPSFHGDGLRYHVYDYHGEDAIREMVKWNREEGVTIYGDRYCEAMESWLDRLQIPQAVRPDSENCSYWYQTRRDNSQIIVIWDREENRLYIGESFL